LGRYCLFFERNLNQGSSAIFSNQISYHQGSRFRVQRFRVWGSEGLGDGPRVVAELVSLIEQKIDWEAEKTRTKEIANKLCNENIE